jgi:iron complex transport system substrate-binding protein
MVRPACLLLSASLATLAAGAAAEPVTIETARGPVTLEAAPERVVVFDIAALDSIDALGVAPVGVPDKLFVPYLEHLAGEAEKVGTIFEPDLETVAALEPDLIVVGSRSSTQYDTLADIAPTIDMTITGEQSLSDEAVARIEAYGTLFEAEDAAAELVADIESKLETARAAVADAGDALIVMTNGPKVSAYGPGSRFGWLHSELGLAATIPDVEAATHGEAISFEFIHEADPDWLVVVDRSAAIGEEAAAARETLDNPLVAETQAWKNDNLVFLDAASIYVADGGYRSLTGLLDQVADAFGE